MAKEEISLQDLRKKVETMADNVTIGYRFVYVLVSIGLVVFGLCDKIGFWTVPITALITAIGLDLFEYIATILSYLILYFKYEKANTNDNEKVAIDKSKKMYWVCWFLKVIATIILVVSLGYSIVTTAIIH